MNMFTRRGFLRNYKEAPIHFRNTDANEVHNATMCDCSCRGMQFVSDRYLKPGSSIVINLNPNGKRICKGHLGGRCAAEVRWCQAQKNGGFFIGVQFSDIPEQ